MSKISGVESVYGKVSTTQVTEDLPVSSGTALEIDGTGNMTMQIFVYVAANFYWTIAATAAAAVIRIAADTTRCRWPAGFYQLPVSGDDMNKLYIISVGAAVTDGISYTLVEAD